MTTVSSNAPKVLIALHFVILYFCWISDVFAIRLGRSVTNVSGCPHADGSTLIYYLSDLDPNFHFYETEDTALDIRHITSDDKARFI